MAVKLVVAAHLIKHIHFNTKCPEVDQMHRQTWTMGLEFTVRLPQFLVH